MKYLLLILGAAVAFQLAHAAVTLTQSATVLVDGTCRKVNDGCKYARIQMYSDGTVKWVGVP